MKKEKICGIYKITSPSGRIYIGQSINMKRRIGEYKYKKIKNQRKLGNSVNKYGWNSHIFEVIEECDIEDLNCRERYWQDFYDVLNGGLNSVLQECGAQRFTISEETRKIISENSKKKRKKVPVKEISREASIMIEVFRTLKKREENPVKYTLINLENGEVFYGLDIAAKITGININTLFKIFSGKRINNTNLILLSEYEEDKIYEIKNFKVDDLLGRKVINLENNKVYNTIKEASKDIENFSYISLLKMLKGESKNKTTFRYL